MDLETCIGILISWPFFAIPTILLERLIPLAYAVGRSITNGEASVAHAYLGHAVRAADAKLYHCKGEKNDIRKSVQVCCPD